jgi:hypothetical protein
MPACATVVTTGFVDPSVISSNASDEVSVNVNSKRVRYRYPRAFCVSRRAGITV